MLGKNEGDDTVTRNLLEPCEEVEQSVVLEARGLTKNYRSSEIEVQALRGVDLVLLKGEFVVLLGASGSGKSTLLNILGGLDVPSSGQVLYRGADVTTFDERKRTIYRRDHISFIFQFYNLIPSLTARENVAMVTELVHDPLSPEDALALVGLGHRMDHFPAQLSGGEQQRVAVARAIAKRPRILLCDEPTGALDSKTGIIVLEAIDVVTRKLGTTTVIITHNSTIGDMADRIVYLADGNTTEVRHNPRRRPAAELSW
jgi:putative ABC transport system ATP-binding protein